MRIATWNVNSIRSRLDQLTGWLARANPDVLCMQETKVEDDGFPEQALSDSGYKTVFFGQRTYNGVAISARFGLSIEDVKKGLDGDEPDAQKRLVAATIEGIRVVNVYVPNGQSVGAPAFLYKLEWLKRLREEVANRYSAEQQVLICGDFNVAPEVKDVAEPKKWEGQVLCSPDERAALKALMDWGFLDAFRARYPDKVAYSWWDYRTGAFRKNKGLRIDLMLVTQALFARCADVWVDVRPRELQKPSDHAPVVVEIGE